VPETPDWAAPPQSANLSKVSLLEALEAAANFQVLIGVAGQRVVLTGIGLAFSNTVANFVPKDMVVCVPSDWLTGTQLTPLAISPESPAFYLPIAPGSVVLTVGADIAFQLSTSSGSGAAWVWVSAFYYLTAA